MYQKLQSVALPIFCYAITAFPSLVRYEFRSEATVQQEFQGLDCTSREVGTAV
jgi:hypothetical protein